MGPSKIGKEPNAKLIRKYRSYPFRIVNSRALARRRVRTRPNNPTGRIRGDETSSIAGSLGNSVVYE